MLEWIAQHPAWLIPMFYGGLVVFLVGISYYVSRKSIASRKGESEK